MLCRMIDLKVPAKLMDATQTLKLPGVDAVPDDLVMHMDIAVNGIPHDLYFFGSLKHGTTSNTF